MHTESNPSPRPRVSPVIPRRRIGVPSVPSETKEAPVITPEPLQIVRHAREQTNGKLHDANPFVQPLA